MLKSKSILGYVLRVQSVIALFKNIKNNRHEANELKEEVITVRLNDEYLYSVLRETLGGVKYFHKAFAIAFEHMELFDFKNTSSVDSDFRTYGGNSRYDLLEKVSLLEHCINTLRASTILNSKKSDGDKSLFALMALLHDFGKSRHIKEYAIQNAIENLHEIDLTGHWHYSALYARVILKNAGISDDIVTQVSNVFKNHHSPEYAKSQHNKDFMANLCAADEQARTWEVDVLSKGKNLLVG